MQYLDDNYSMLSINHNNKIPYTNAPIPIWVQYDTYQQKNYGNPEAVERYFQQTLGKEEISDEYISSIQNTLQNIDDFIRAFCSRRPTPQVQKMWNDVSYTTLYACEDYLTDTTQIPFILLDNIIVRPCAEKLGIFRIIIWQILQSCLQWGCDFRIENLIDNKVQSIFEKMNVLGPGREQFFRRIFSTKYRKIQWAIQRDNIKNITIEQVGINRMIIPNPSEPWKIVINPMGLPEARELNHQGGVNTRLQRLIHLHQRDNSAYFYGGGDEGIALLTDSLNSQMSLGTRKYSDDVFQRSKKHRPPL